jgi:hypothetical protein
MITFQGNKRTLISAKMLERNAKNIYPHISTSRIRTQIGIENPDPIFFKKLKKDYSLARQMIRESGDTYTSIVYSMKYGGLGNCTEDSLLTELLGKINGQKNIYTGALGLKKSNGISGHLNHVVAFITDKPIEDGKDYFFKNKEAVVIDPWLGVTDFAGNYFTKLKSIYRNTFMFEKNRRFLTFTNDNLANTLIRSVSKNAKDFNKKKKEYCPTTSISITPFIDNSLNSSKIESIKESFPELVLKHFKKIVLSEK